MAHTARTGSGTHWLVSPSPGDTFKSQGWPETARRIIVTSAGDLFLIPVGGAAGNGELFYTGATPGMQFDQQCDGLGGSSTCDVTAQF